jgi:hypothetical protein
MKIKKHKKERILSNKVKKIIFVLPSMRKSYVTALKRRACSKSITGSLEDRKWRAAQILAGNEDSDQLPPQFRLWVARSWLVPISIFNIFTERSIYVYM